MLNISRAKPTCRRGTRLFKTAAVTAPSFCLHFPALSHGERVTRNGESLLKSLAARNEELGANLIAWEVKITYRFWESN